MLMVLENWEKQPSHSCCLSIPPEVRKDTKKDGSKFCGSQSWLQLEMQERFLKMSNVSLPQDKEKAATRPRAFSDTDVSSSIIFNYLARLVSSPIISYFRFFNPASRLAQAATECWYAQGEAC